MKKKTYKHGPHKFTAYLKPVGQGWESGFKYGPKPIFVGNFVHKKEATEWYTKMNKEIPAFSKKYWVGPDCSMPWYQKFFSKHLYQVYYKYLDKVFATHQRTYRKEFEKEQKKYEAIKKQKTWDKKEQVPFIKAA